MKKTSMTDAKHAYKWLLGRIIESEDAKSAASRHPDSSNLRLAIMRSNEFNLKCKSQREFVASRDTSSLFDDGAAKSGGRSNQAVANQALTQALSVEDPLKAAELIRVAASHFLSVKDYSSAIEAIWSLAEVVDYDLTICVKLCDSLARIGHPQAALGLWVEALEQHSSELKPGMLKSMAAGMPYDKASSPLKNHGHALLIEHLITASQSDTIIHNVLEIGTTRERLPGQDSTRALAILCQNIGANFTTVDIDARNAELASRFFTKNGMAFKAMNISGEEFSKSTTESYSAIFLDAYDIDHGEHGERRQSQYVALTGKKINNEACYIMHLECVTALLPKLEAGGFLCIDDTWCSEDGVWEGKGRLAVPYALEKGLNILAISDSAVLLSKKDQE